MTRFIRKQDRTQIYMNGDGDLVLLQEALDDNHAIYISFGNIENFIDAIQNAVADGYKGDDNEMV